MLKEHEEIAEFYQRQFQFILVDEYQDTNKIQADFIDLLAAEHQNVMVVGDDAQSIYSWRGANFKNILDFPRRYPDAQVFKIEMNYRSVPEILHVANAAIAAEHAAVPKDLSADAPNEPRAARHGRAERRRRAGALRRPAHPRAARRRHRAERDRGALPRALSRGRIAAGALAPRHSLQITSGLRFFEQAHIKDVAAFIRFVANPRDEVAFKRMVRLLPGIGGKSAEIFGKAGRNRLDENAVIVSWSERLRPMPVGAARRKDPGSNSPHTLDEIAPGGQPKQPTEMIMSIVEAIYDDYAKANFANYDLRKEDLNQLAGFARQFKDIHEFLSQLALISNVDAEPAVNQAGEKEAVNLSSVHQAKGLEFHSRLRHLADRRHVPERALARDARGDRGRAPPFLRRRHPRARTSST